LPFKDPDRIVMMFGANLETGERRGAVSPPDFVDYREQQRVLDNFAACTGGSFNLTGAGEPERFIGACVTSGFFNAVGIEPLHGRTFTAEEEQPGSDQVAMISYGLWQRRFGSDPDLVGKAVTINDKSFTVVGIMPQGFQFPRD